MKKRTYLRLHDLPGLGRLVIDSLRGLTGIIEAMHRSIARVPPGEPTRGITGLVYGSIRGATDIADSAGSALAQLIPLADEQSSTPEREALRAALNGVVGDHLAATQNRLAISMHLRQNGRSLVLDGQSLSEAIAQPNQKLLVLVHGLCRSDLQWNRQGHDHGVALARDLGYTPVYLHYNSGLHISTNGNIFARQLEALVKAWPTELEELAILGHSMGGLVARSAYHSALVHDQAWPSVLRKLIFLGTPHHGSPLERGGNWFQAALGMNTYTAPLSRLGRIRSAGITDMRCGSLLDEDWKNQDRFHTQHTTCQPVPLPTGVACYTIGAVTGSKASGVVDAFVGDGLVPLNSALGYHSDPSQSLAFPESHQWIGYEMNHLDLLNKSAVYEQIRQWLAT